MLEIQCVRLRGLTDVRGSHSMRGRRGGKSPRYEDRIEIFKIPSNRFPLQEEWSRGKRPDASPANIRHTISEPLDSWTRGMIWILKRKWLLLPVPKKEQRKGLQRSMFNVDCFHRFSVNMPGGVGIGGLMPSQTPCSNGARNRIGLF